MSAFQTSETVADNVSFRREVHYMGSTRLKDRVFRPPPNHVPSPSYQVSRGPETQGRTHPSSVVLHRPTRRKGKAMLAHCPTRFVRGAKHEHKALLDPAVTDSAAQRERRVR